MSKRKHNLLLPRHLPVVNSEDLEFLTKEELIDIVIELNISLRDNLKRCDPEYLQELDKKLGNIYIDRDNRGCFFATEYTGDEE